jgi:hypothetical protein
MPNAHLQGWFAASVPKAGSRAAENEDATAADLKRVRFAVADGATEGWQSRPWAQHLAGAFVRRPPGPADFPKWLAKVRRDWKPKTPKNEAWYASVKQEQGSFATLLGLEFRRSTDSSGLVWKAVAVGDSCLFILRGDRFEVAFPVSSAAAFGTSPPLVPSSQERECPEPEWLAGWAEPGDLFLLATDAVARLLLDYQMPPRGIPLVAAALQAVTSGSGKPVVQLLGELQTELKDDASMLAVRVAEQ